MKRPIPTYFVVVWCLLVLCIQWNHLSGFLDSLFADAAIDAGWRQGLYAGFTLLFVVALWQVFLLLQFRAFSFKLSIAVFVWSTANLVWTTWHLLPRVPNALRMLVGILICAALNIGCIWYLGRRSFRDFAAQFVAERAARKRELSGGTNIRNGKPS